MPSTWRRIRGRETIPAILVGILLHPEAAMNRRQFVRRGAVAAALFGIPPAQAEQAFGDDPPRLPPKSLFRSDPDRYWAELRRQWLLAADRINLNCGSVGCTP